MEQVVFIIHIIAALAVIGLVLLQHGKGADMGASFGSGASGSLFGVSGSSNLLSRATSVSVVVFFATSLSLAYIASHKDNGSVVSGAAVESVVDEAATEPMPAKTTTTDDIPK